MTTLLFAMGFALFGCLSTENHGESSGTTTHTPPPIATGYVHTEEKAVNITVRFTPPFWAPFYDELTEEAKAQVLSFNVDLLPGKEYKNIFELAGITSDYYQENKTEEHAHWRLMGSYYIVRINPETKQLDPIWHSQRKFALMTFEFQDGDEIYASTVQGY